MDVLALGVAGLLVLLIVVQAGLAIGFLFALTRFRRRLLKDDDCPRAAVILCLRGTDPFLSRCLHAIIDQDYPDFQLRIVIDHPSDPAARVVEEILTDRAASHVNVEILREHRRHCSLKCSSLVQAVKGCGTEVKFVAQLDADTIPHRSWLRELATALADDQVGAATGNRWYMPDEVSLAPLVRYAWNAAAVVQMYWYRIAWGGTLAVKTQTIAECGLIDRWSNAFCEDTMLFRLLREHSWKVAFVPSLMMVNRESCSFDGFHRWVQRQLLTARLYHPRWPAVVAHGLGTSLALALALGLAIVAVVLGHVAAAVWLALAIVSYELAMVLLLLPIEWQVRRIASERGETTAWLGLLGFIKLFITIPITQFSYPSLLMGAQWMRRVDWRGVSYRVDGPWKIELVEYQPYEPLAVDMSSTVSL